MSLLKASGIPDTIEQYQLALDAAVAAGKVMGEQALLQKLAAGVSVEPFDTWHETDDDAGAWARASRPVYEFKQLQTAIAAARVQAVTDCIRKLNGNIYNLNKAECVEEIRALLGGLSQS